MNKGGGDGERKVGMQSEEELQAWQDIVGNTTEQDVGVCKWRSLGQWEDVEILNRNTHSKNTDQKTRNRF